MRAKLSPTMRMALEVVEAHPGTRVSELPGGIRTVRALMRRELVELDPEPVVTVWDSLVFAPAHDHRFATTMHVDGCHFWQSSGSCACGATIVVYGERNAKTDPWEPIGDGLCQRCGELEAGARPRFHVEIVGPKRQPVAA